MAPPPRLSPPQWRWVIFSVFAALLWTCSKLAVPLLVAAAVDQGIVPGDTGEIVKYTGLIVFVGLLQGIGMGMRRYGALRMSYRVETNLRARLFAHLQLLHFAYHDEAQTGQLMAHANTDLYQISQWLSLGPISLSSLFILIGVIIVMLLASPVLALLALGALPLLNVMATRFSRQVGTGRVSNSRRSSATCRPSSRRPSPGSARSRASAPSSSRSIASTPKPTRCSNARSSPHGCAPASSPRSTSSPRSRSRRSSGTEAIR